MEAVVPTAHSFADQLPADAPLTIAPVYVAQSFAEPSFLCVDTPVAHSFADASVAVVVGVVASCAQFLADPPAARTDP